MEEINVKPQIKKKYPWGERIFIWTLLAAPLVQLAIFYFYVNFSAFTLAFKELNKDMTYTWVGFAKFAEVWADFIEPNSILMISFRNSLLKFFISEAVKIPMVFLIAYYVYKRLPGALVFRIISMLPTIISSLVITLVVKMFMNELPKLGAQIGIAIPKVFASENAHMHFAASLIYSIWLGWSSAAIIYPNRINSIDGAIMESAQLEGVSMLQELWYIILPMLMPTFTTFTVVAVSGILTESGSLFALWGYGADTSAWNIGYLIFKRSTDSGQVIDPTVWYPYVAALGLLCSVVSVPLTFGIKKILEKADPLND